jgi:hypothetical protein
LDQGIGIVGQHDAVVFVNHDASEGETDAREVIYPRRAYLCLTLFGAPDARGFFTLIALKKPVAYMRKEPRR